MSRDEMIQALGQYGFDPSKITEGVPDEFLADLLAKLQPPAGDGAAKAAPPPDATDMDEADGDGPAPGGEAPPAASRDEMLAALADAGYDPADLADLTDEELAELMEEEAQGDGGEEMAEGDEEMAEGDEPAGDGDHKTTDTMLSGYAEGEDTEPMKKNDDDKKPGAKAPDAAMSERAVNDRIDRLVRERLAAVEGRIAAASKQADEVEGNIRRKNVTAFCEGLRAAGKLLPVEFSPTVSRLLRADHRNKVQTFADGKSVEMTELELQMAELEKRPTLFRFGEKLPTAFEDPKLADGEKAKVEAHYESFSEQFSQMGMTKEKFVQGFEAGRKRNPRLTAQDYVNP